MSTPQTLSEVVGNNAKQIRVDGNATLEQMAKACRHYGLPWTIGRVGSFESGHVTLTLETLVAVCAALRAVTTPNRSVALPDLFAGPGVAPSDRITMSLARWRKVVSGEPVKIGSADVTGERERVEKIGKDAEADFRSWPRALQKVDLGLRVRVLANFAEGDHVLARSLNISDGHAAAAMAHRWGRTFVAERNKRAGGGANPQRRGHVSRELKVELKEVLDGDD